MTTIGTAVLQIIPSLRGVTAEIEKQTDGVVIEVPVAPKVDKPATQKAGKDAGDTITKEVKDAVKKGDIGKSVGDSVKESVKRGGLRESASDAAGEFGKGFLEGIAGELRNARIGNVLEGINTQVRTTTSLIQGIGGVAGIDVSPIVSASDTISGAIGEIQTAASNTKTQVDSVITPLQQFGELAGPDSKLYKVTGKLPLIGQFVELLPALREGNTQLEGIVAKYTGLNVPLSGESWVRWLTDNGAAFNSAEANARQKLADAQAAAAANAGPIYRDPNHTGPGRAGGGMIPGFSTRDDRLGLVGGRGLIGLAGGEGIVKASATRKLGGAPFIDWLNGFADGGVVPPDVAAAQALAGTKYSQGARTDCSGMVARVIARTLGMSESGLMSTKTASDWLAARGFLPGSGGPGQISVGWYDHGPNPNDGHMAMTLSDGRNAESGGSSGPFTIGGSAAGANSPQFDQHMHLPTVYGEGPASSGSASSPFAGGSASAAATGAAPTSSGGDAAPTPSSSSISLPSSFTGFGSFAGEQLGKQLGDEKLGKLTSAAGSLIDGQVSSALDVFGIPGSPGWLQGISTLIGGISIGGGSSANPLAANQQPFTNASGDAANMHGTHAAQAPGPTYNITARDTEDAFIKAQRLEREKAAAKLSRF